MAIAVAHPGTQPDGPDGRDTARPGSTTAPEQPTGAGRAVVSSFVGTAIEWYDFFIYGTAAALVLGPQFFPGGSELAGTLAAFATLAVGFIARPFGG
ncbi:MAG: MFS transporter, partial [Dietzia sp.]